MRWFDWIVVALVLGFILFISFANTNAVKQIKQNETECTEIKNTYALWRNRRLPVVLCKEARDDN